jgi:hypothetical protein
MKLHTLSLVVGAAATALAIAVASSFGLGVAPIAAQSNEAHNAMMAAQKAQVMAATFQLDNSGLHDLDVKLNAGEMVPGALGKIRNARVATQATVWPDAMKENVDKLVASMTQLEQALRDEDVAKAAPLAKDVHDVGHDVSAAAYQWLTGAQPSGGHGH